MFRKRDTILGLVVFIALLLAGCRCDNSVIPTYYGIGDTPADGEVTSLTPSFDWHGSDSCEPDSFIFRIDEDGGPPAAMTITEISMNNLPYTYVGGVGAPLEPGKSYTWSLKAVNGSQGNNPPVMGPQTEIGQFFTGPICSGETLVAPDLQDPEPAAWVGDDPYLFKWTYPGGCLPESYEIQFALDPGFTNIAMTVSTTELYQQELLMTFLDCTSRWWRVRAFDGSSYGPWSAGRDFHFVQGSGCWQWQYLSEDFAWIYVRLDEDRCQQTGYWAATTMTLDDGCQVEGSIILGTGTQKPRVLDSFIVDLGAGPCPSTGLDQKTVEAYTHTKFGVVTPGAYCVSISRNQTANWGDEVYNLMDGIWTKPRVNGLLAEQTVEFTEAGVHSEVLDFVWDEMEYNFLAVPLGHTYECKFGPQDQCPTIEYARAGETIPLLARDRGSDWKQTQLKGQVCYINLPAVQIQQYLDENEAGVFQVEDLGYFVPPDPCALPEPCSSYGNQESCKAAGCKWEPVVGRIGGGTCKEK